MEKMRVTNGDIVKDAYGKWILKLDSGGIGPIPDVFRAVLDQLELRERQYKAFNESSSKPSYHAPSLWEGPMPGDRSLSFSRMFDVVAAGSSVSHTVEFSGHLLIREVHFHGPLLSEPRSDLALQIIDHGGIGHTSIISTFTGSSLPVYLIFDNSPVEFKITNSSLADLVCLLAAVAWERIPPVIRSK
jgi:hypothetical protein